MKKLKPKRTNLKKFIKRKKEEDIFYNTLHEYIGYDEYIGYEDEDDEDDEIFKKLLTYPEEYQQKAAVENECGYVVHKAYSLLKNPPSKEDLEYEEDLELLIEGCRQTTEYIGHSEEFPYTNIGINGFYDLYNYFGFSATMQEATSIEKEDGLYYMDKMTMKHNFYENHNMIVYNLVKSEYEPD